MLLTLPGTLGDETRVLVSREIPGLAVTLRPQPKGLGWCTTSALEGRVVCVSQMLPTPDSSPAGSECIFSCQ